MTFLRWIAIGALTLAAVGAGKVMLDLRRAYARIAGLGEVVATAQGELHFQQGGVGPAVLVVHGSGGGSDQGELVARAVLGDGFHWIAPSRFGYLRSSLPSGASFDDQAHAYARLLDSLHIQKVSVVALSHGGPSALLFALLYPERVASLTLLSCGVASAPGADQAQANSKGDALTTIFRYDLLYWAVSQLLRSQLVTLMGADPTLLASLGAQQRELVDQVIDFMSPVAPRHAGVVFDNRAALPNQRIASIRAPTLVVHARDDTLQLFRNAQFAAAHIAGARLLSFDRGGHLLIAVEQPVIQAQVQQFIRAHPSD